MQKNGLIRKIMLISKFMTSQPGKQNTPKHAAQYSQEAKAFNNEFWSVNRI